jgi:hypothetical protein
MSPKLEQAIERLQGVVAKLEKTKNGLPQNRQPSADHSALKAEIAEIRDLVDEALTLMAKNMTTDKESRP